MADRVAKTFRSLPGVLVDWLRYFLSRRWKLLAFSLLVFWWRRVHRPHFRSALLTSARVERKKSTAKKEPSAAEQSNAELTEAILCAFRAAKESEETTVLARMRNREGLHALMLLICVMFDRHCCIIMAYVRTFLRHLNTIIVLMTLLC